MSAPAGVVAAVAAGSGPNGVVLEARGVGKSFGATPVLRDVDLALRAGEIHALCGENGAGKSTLIKILSGVHPAGSFAGSLQVEGRAACFRSVRDATAAGLAVIHQELALVEGLTVADNLFLGDEPRRRGLLDVERMAAEARHILGRFPGGLSPEARVAGLGMGRKQLVEIAKALRRDCRVLVLDEPTAALSAEEAAVLHAVLRDLRGRGIASLLVSHRLDEVFALADRITVLRDGAVVASAPSGALGREEVIRHMVGRPVGELYPRRASTPGPERLAVQDVVVHGPGRVLGPLSFSVAAGEVLGLGGLVGAGRSEILLHLVGAWGRRSGGRLRLGGRPLDAGIDPETALRAGLVLVSEDRKRLGLIPGASVRANLTLSSLGRHVRRGLLDDAGEETAARAQAAALALRGPGLDAPVARLSGGNQQKVVLGRVLAAEPQVVLLDEPTRGVDVGARVEVYTLINRMTAEGRAVVMASSDLPELIGMSDRILMMRDGRMAGHFSGAEATPERLMAAAVSGEAA